MRRFVFKVSLFLGLQGAIAAAILALGSEPPTDEYLAAAVDKDRWLAEAPGPRVVFVGSSGWAFGLDSRLVAEATGYTPVNLGHHAGLGLDYVLDQARSGIRRGDTVVIALEYVHFTDDPAAGAQWPRLLDLHPGSLSRARAGQARRLLDGGGNYLGWRLRRVLAVETPQASYSVYTRHAFNRFGDLALRREPLAGAGVFDGIRLDHVSPASIERTAAKLAAFEAWCRARGATPVYTHPVIPPAEYERWSGWIERIDGAIRRHTTLPVLAAPGEAVMPAEWFFDTGYHLTTEGARERTAALVAALVPAYLPPAEGAVLVDAQP